MRFRRPRFTSSHAAICVSNFHKSFHNFPSFVTAPLLYIDREKRWQTWLIIRVLRFVSSECHATHRLKGCMSRYSSPRGHPFILMPKEMCDDGQHVLGRVSCCSCPIWWSWLKINSVLNILVSHFSSRDVYWVTAVKNTNNNAPGVS